MSVSNIRSLIFLIVLGFIGLSSLITILYFDRKENKKIKENIKRGKERKHK